MARKSNHANKVLSAKEHEKTVKEALKYASLKNHEATVQETVRGFIVELPSPSGVLAALMEKSAEMNAQCATLMQEMSAATNTRERGEKRRHYNQLTKKLQAYWTVIGKLMDKNVVRDDWNVQEEQASEPETKAKAPKPKAKAKSPKKAAAKKLYTKKQLDDLQYKDLQLLCKKHGKGAGGNREKVTKRLLSIKE